MKYVATNYSVIQAFANVTFKSSATAPVIFTSRNDQSVGEDLYLAGAATNYFQALACGTPDIEYKHLRMAYADYGLHTYSMKLRHAQFVHCGTALYTEHTPWYGSGGQVDNVLFYDVGTAFGGGNFITGARHVTVDRCATLASDWYGGSSVALTNSLLVNVTNNGSVSISTNFTVKTASSPFQVAGAGAHYLANGSPFRNAGTTNIPGWLLADLRQRTTFPPIVVTNATIATNAILGPSIPRSSGAPDLGYNYFPLDYVYGSNVLTNASLKIYSGTVLGTFTPGSNTHGLFLSAGANLSTFGTPLAPVRIVRYNTVQEQANDAWLSQYPGAQIRSGRGPLSPVPAGTFDFTDWSVPGSSPQHVDIQSSNTTSFVFRNCEFDGGRIRASTAQVDFKNCLLQRVDGYVTDYLNQTTSTWSNNTFFGGTFSFYNSGLWQIFNNAFYDTADLGSDSGLLHGWNAYLPGAPMVAGWLSNGIVTNIVFQSGPLGDFYLTNSSPLINRGSCTAASAGLFHFTTATNQAKEGSSTVDIGFHRAALTNGSAGELVPIDSDLDGWADYVEDANGNGFERRRCHGFPETHHGWSEP